MVITASQIQWTTNVTKALLTCNERGDNAALKSLKKKQVHFSIPDPKHVRYDRCRLSVCKFCRTT